MSSHQQEASPEQQREQLAALAKKHNATIVAEYFDEGISGVATDKRRGFLKMLEDAKAGKFKLILAWDQDRFSRLDSIDSGEIIAPLRRAGVRLITCGQGEIDWNTFAGRLVFNVAQEGKNQFLMDLSKNLCRSLLHRGQAGELFSKPPYGYERVIFDNTGREVRRVRHGETFRKPRGWTAQIVLAEDLELSQTVRWLFEQFANTESSLQSLAIELNRRGLKTSRGKAWRHDAVAEILANAFYAGVYTFGKTKMGKFHHVGAGGDIEKTTDRAKHRAPVIVLEDHHPAIVDRATFDRVQSRMADRKLNNRRPRTSSFPLSGVLKCGHCGGSLSGSTNTDSKGKSRRYYYCFNGSRGTCAQFRIAADRIEQTIAEFVKTNWLAPEGAEMLAAELRRQARAQLEVAPGADKESRAKLAKLEKQIERGQENLLLADPQDVPACQKMLSGWRVERDRLKTTLEAAGGALATTGKDIASTVAAATKELQRLHERMTGGDQASARAAFAAMFREVGLLFHSREGGRGRFQLARVLISMTSQIHSYAGNRT